MDSSNLDFLDSAEKHSVSTSYVPLLLDLATSKDSATLAQLHEDKQIEEVVDNLSEALEDLFRIDFPYIAPGSPEFATALIAYRQEYYANQPAQQVGIWAYFPWKHSVVHLPKSEDFLTLRTARNKFLITQEEQDKFYYSTIGLAGLSVGSAILNTVVLSGGGASWRIADLDTLAITNLNRLPGSVCDLGRSKAINAARRTYETDPFLNLELFEQGFDEDHMDDFFNKDGKKLDLFLEEMDNIRLKIISRFRARELGIPVVMATDNGDNTMLDVERFDLEPNRQLFHGLVDENQLRNTSHELSLAERVRLANAIVGPDVTPRMQQSLQMVGTRLPNWPQLGNAATLSGAATSYVARRILAGLPMPSGRYHLHLDRAMDVEYMTDEAATERARLKQDFIDGFNLLYGAEPASNH